VTRDIARQRLIRALAIGALLVGILLLQGRGRPTRGASRYIAPSAIRSTPACMDPLRAPAASTEAFGAERTGREPLWIQVVSQSTGLPVPHAMCQFIGQDSILGRPLIVSRLADASGLAALDVPTESSGSVSAYAAAVSTAGACTCFQQVPRTGESAPVILELPLGCKYCGVARDELGGTLSGVEIQGFDSAFRGVAFSNNTWSTDASGRFEIPDLGTGSYMWRFRCPGYVDTWRDTVIQTSGQIVADDCILRKAPSNLCIQIRVRSAEGGGPIHGAVTRLLRTRKSSLTDYDVIGSNSTDGGSDADGNAQLIIDGQQLCDRTCVYYLRTECSGLSIASTRFTIPTSSTSAAVVIQVSLSAAALVRGKIVSRDTADPSSVQRQPYSGAVLRFRSREVSESELPIETYVSVGENGRFVVESLPPGLYEVACPRFATTGEIRLPHADDIVVDIDAQSVR